ncbi:MULTISPECIES: hypothetical protein [Sulfitobacter]|jgi:hypothetical protein|uniref:Uncharacterized protein n=2 Tax=root TaxID=1 RepID=A0A1H0UNT8_9RHOB|nr:MULTISPECIES: hypothetical protein [Sulfitobacter]MBQ0716089.1 hypothetical protein [Sulfitobacter litoralis]MBQ0765299.1 hypothetical protein [Sulfitobacter litoralis]MBQ0801130.1 hypothetical protein [Sulfitobacter litoralis]MCF7726819.1 hypothetical protein [Sulfitobacter sp. M22]MCF7778196.1 hypothetical protein [Sulfitobacter sp. M220]|tara:strand:- start:2696 stop:2896 length:201 start_codon:yes stop_codon:yes gene_type:complete
MSKDTAPQKPPKPNELREDRLKAALKANMGRRKAQARARSDKTQSDDAQNDSTQTDNGPTGQSKEG